MTTGWQTVSVLLRPVILLARMRDVAPPATVARVLASFSPPLNPASPEWLALCAALDAYDVAEQTHSSTGLDAAREQAIAAAVALLTDQMHRGVASAAVCRLPVQCEPGKDRQHDHRTSGPVRR